MRKWPKPENIKAMRGFLGLTGYYRRFIQDYGKIAVPLTRMLKKNNFTWTPSAEAAFEHLKHVMIQAPVLALTDFTKEFAVECDASGVVNRSCLTSGQTYRISQPSMAETTTPLVYLRKGDFGFSFGGAKMVPLFPWKAFCGEIRPTQFEVFVVPKNFHNCPTKMVIQTNGLRFLNRVQEREGKHCRRCPIQEG
jgi:hypothetical protein